jgi:hypothetical protein
MASATDFASFMEPVARMLLGAPNQAMSSKTELRFGAHGSLSIDTTKGTFFDHEHKIGGGVLDLVERVQKLSNGEAIDWLREHGFAVEDLQPSRLPLPPSAAQSAPRGKIVATYDYVDETGELLFQVVRLQSKTFRQRRPDGKGGWDWSVKGTRLVPYRLPDLIEAVAAEEIIMVCEGEKDVENLRALGVPATCNPMGAGKWPEDFAQFFAGARVVVIPDNDESGRKHAQAVGASLRGTAGYVLVLELPDLPPKGDVSDWLAAGGDAERLYALVKTDAKPWTPIPIESRFGAVWFDDVGRQIDRTDWIVKGLFGARDLSLLYGPPKEGKSFLALDLSLSIAAAAVPQLVKSEWFGHHISPGGVVYVAAEGQRGMLRRVTAWRLHRKVEVGQCVPFVLMTTRVDLCSEDGDAPALIAEINALAEFMIVQPRFIVVDTLARAMAGGNENSPDDMGALIDHCGKIQEETGAHVCLVHHVGKDEGRGPRGHNSLHGAIDTSIQVGKADIGRERLDVEGSEGGRGRRLVCFPPATGDDRGRRRRGRDHELRGRAVRDRNRAGRDREATIPAARPGTHRASAAARGDPGPGRAAAGRRPDSSRGQSGLLEGLARVLLSRRHHGQRRIRRRKEEGVQARRRGPPRALVHRVVGCVGMDYWEGMMGTLNREYIKPDKRGHSAMSPNVPLIMHNSSWLSVKGNVPFTKRVALKEKEFFYQNVPQCPPMSLFVRPSRARRYLINLSVGGSERTPRLRKLGKDGIFELRGSAIRARPLAGPRNRRRGGYG